MNFFDSLLHPDHDENPERALVAHAANLLQVGEFQLLQLAFAAWFGREMRQSESSAWFKRFMLAGQVPGWARHYARRIIQLDADGGLDDNDPDYHRYDAQTFRSGLRTGLRHFIVATTIVVGVMGGGLLMASYSARCGDTVLPPCFDQRADQLPWRDAGGTARR